LLIDSVHKFGGALADFVFPRLCCGCGERVFEAKRLVCCQCEATLEALRLPVCVTCGREDCPAGEGLTCDDCPEGTIYFQAARAFTQFSGTAKVLVEKLKYSGRTEFAPLMARYMARVCFTEFKKAEFSAVVPVPLFSARRRERGFNQSEELARFLGSQLYLQVKPDLLRRIRSTGTQTRLSRRERAENIRGAFEASAIEEIAGKTLLLVDDVHTTGATLNECAKALKEAGAAAVYCIAFCRASMK
jgi:ComF family protein